MDHTTQAGPEPENDGRVYVARVRAGGQAEADAAALAEARKFFGDGPELEIIDWRYQAKRAESPGTGYRVLAAVRAVQPRVLCAHRVSVIGRTRQEITEAALAEARKFFGRPDAVLRIRDGWETHSRGSGQSEAIILVEELGQPVPVPAGS
jgi:hypothetical protein